MLLGTCIALVYRVLDTMIYVNKIILNEKVRESAKLYLSNVALFAVVVFMSKQMDIHVNSYITFFFVAFVVFVCCAILFGIVNFSLNRKYLKRLFEKLFMKARK